MAGCWLGIDVVGSVDGLGVGQALQEAGQALAIKSLSHISDRSAQKTSSWTPSQSGTGDGLAVGEPVVGEDVGCCVGHIDVEVSVDGVPVGSLLGAEVVGGLLRTAVGSEMPGDKDGVEGGVN